MKITVKTLENKNIKSGIIIDNNEDIFIFLNEQDNYVKENIKNYINNLQFNN